MSSTYVSHHLRPHDVFRADVRLDEHGREYAVLDIGGGRLDVYGGTAELRRLRDVIGTALAGLAEARVSAAFEVPREVA